MREGDADRFQLGLDHLGELEVVDPSPDGGGERVECEAVGIARFGEQRFRLRRVVRIGLNVRGRVRGVEDVAHPRGATEEQALVDGVPVDGKVEGLPDPLVVEGGRAIGLDADKDAPPALDGIDPDARLADQDLGLVDREAGDDVDATGLQLGDLGRDLGDDAEDDLADRRRWPPVVRIRTECDVIVADALGEEVGAGADHLLGEGGVVVLGVELRWDHRPLGEVEVQQRLRGFGRQAEGGRVDGGRLGDFGRRHGDGGAAEGLARRVALVEMVDAELRGGGVEGSPLLKVTPGRSVNSQVRLSGSPRHAVASSGWTVMSGARKVSVWMTWSATLCSSLLKSW